ncbi:hypothetical protein SEA_ZARTROSA_70 [Arthrobacter phage Zartrosa]|uniref:Uncharacterized protein n=2 Tax=Marthavirus TaxID=1980936 RepID=A0A5B8WKR9_9CAUD|nr:hypothetical protein FDI42_gp68 [Arthrobacter phage Shade]YP_009884291.1 hypothetical protein HYP98_gp70 [Arthrobacter phage Zartrosa]ASR80622.1 hypothetical protein SEA_JORDAN_69 [Arthrobacter phage Jordan]ASR80773.1 hypothetical protein SEA_SHADE_68 [Arthrobacter phage Shade]QED11182.1 hypothetical protein SEA_ZARTROSA_70 [Arthrobacter phage Zartrosa]
MRCCPACTKRHAQLVDPKCPVCRGAGVVRLGPAALALHEPEVVAHAVAIALEAEARDIDLKLTRSDDRLTPLRNTVKALTEAGILDYGIRIPTAVQKVVEKSHTAEELAARLTEVIIVDVDAKLINAPACEYDPHDRPNARGLPTLSANGHPSHLAQLTDPAEIGESTAERHTRRSTQQRRAQMLVAAVPETIKIKRKRKADK